MSVSTPASSAHPMFECAGCTKTYPSLLAALDCADQDELEADDRAKGRLFRSNR